MADFEQAVDDALEDRGTIKGNVDVFMVKNPHAPGEPDKSLDEIGRLLPYRRGVVYFSLADLIEDGTSYSHSCGYEHLLLEANGFLHPDGTWLDRKAAQFLMHQGIAQPGQHHFYVVPFMVYPSVEDINIPELEWDIAQIANATNMMIGTFLVTDSSGTSLLPQVKSGRAGSYDIDWSSKRACTSTEADLQAFSEEGFRNYVAARDKIDKWVRQGELD